MTVVHHPMHLLDRVAMTAMRLMISSMKGTVRGPDARPGFDELMEKVPSAKHVTYVSGNVGGIPGWWCTPAAQIGDFLRKQLSISRADQPERTAMATDNSQSMRAPGIPDDDTARQLTNTNPNTGSVPHISVAGDTYTILVGGDDSAGRYCLIDMHVPPGGGPPPHRHDFEEMFSVVDGEIEVMFRGDKMVVSKGSTINIPANAPHAFSNKSDKPARLLCMCTPSGQEEFFMQVGDRVDGRTAPPPKLSKEEQEERMKRAKELAPKYRTELLG